jgi:hypothetical protein
MVSHSDLGDPRYSNPKEAPHGQDHTLHIERYVLPERR